MAGCLPGYSRSSYRLPIFRWMNVLHYGAITHVYGMKRIDEYRMIERDIKKVCVCGIVCSTLGYKARALCNHFATPFPLQCLDR